MKLCSITFSYFFTSPSPFSSSHSWPFMASTDRSNLSNPNNVIDVEVSMAECHARIKIRCRKFPKQLRKIVSGLHSLRLTVLHLNVSTAHEIALYSFTLKVEEDCGLCSEEEISRGVYQLLCRIQEEAFSV
ncbi:transcription factor bHLH96-like [Cucurbita moschata]|uniref:Transcription factor bHLH96-like n=1 Tax=Cucurbita moschata TaxID=3662 RepID=A0A6J1HC29_CUCMO|nr:transcription factor bHLH96-like [Cucurbita moschata]